MEMIKGRTAMFSKVLRIVYVSVLLVHLLLWAMGVKGQSVVESPRTRIRNIYTSQIGVREKQPNSGPEVEEYLRYVNLQKGNPWCAAFVCWVLGEAGVTNPRTGWSPGIFSPKRVIWVRRAGNGEWGIENGKWGMGLNAVKVRGDEPGTRSQGTGLRFAYPPSPTTSNQKPTTSNNQQPKTADIFGLYFPEKGRIAHVGFVDEWKEPWVTTVEGNTNILGSREGDGVYRKRRLVRSVYQVARYVE